MSLATETTFVTNIYQNVLLQPAATVTASQGQIASWANLIASGVLTEQQALTDIVTTGSTGAWVSSYVVPLVQLYEGFYHATPDIAGLQSWVAYFSSVAPLSASGATPSNYSSVLSSIAQVFASNTQFTATYGSAPTAQAFVTALYQNILGRAPDAAGLAGYVSYLTSTAGASPSVSAMASLALAFVNSAEAKADATTPIQTWLQGGVNGTYGTTIPGINGVPQVTTVNLTSSVDSVTVTAANTVINGVAQGTSPTFSVQDSVNGAGFTNVSLNIADQATGGTWTPTALAGVKIAGVQTVTFSSAEGVTANTASSSQGYSGLTQLNVNSIGATAVTAAATTNVAVTNARPHGGATTVDGGLNVNVSVTSAGTDAAAGATSVDTVTIGGTTAPSGTVTVSVANTLLAGGAGATTTAGAINVTGGTTVSVTETQSGNTAGTKAAVGDTTLGAINVTGTAATTTVSVTQTAAATGAAAVSAVANVSNASAAVAGVVDGGVSIADANAANATTATAAGLSGSIASVTLANYGASNISSAALKTLTLSGTGGTLGLYEGGSTAATNTALTLNLGGGRLGAITDNSNQFQTLNAALTANTTVASFADTALRTIALSGTGVLSLTNFNNAVTAVTLSGAAGLNTDVSSATGLSSINASNTTGAITLTLNPAGQSFTGGSGRDVITIGADATQKITAGSASNNELILTQNGSTYTAANTVANVTGFQTLGINTSTATTAYDLSVLKGFTSLEVIQSGATSTTFNKVAAGTSLTIDQAVASVIYNLADTNGANDSVAVNLGLANNSAAGFTVGNLTLQDANGVGINAVTINSTSSIGGAVDTITTLTDPNLSSLTMTGTAGLIIGTLNTAATSFTIANNDTSTDTTQAITTLGSTGNTLGSINFSGTHSFTIGTLNDTVANATITNANTGTTGVLTIGSWADNNLASLTLNGSVAATITSNSTASVTISGQTDNANVSFTNSGANAGTANSVTLGNGNDTVDFSTAVAASKVAITLGTGTDIVRVGAGTNTVTFGTHAATAADTLQLFATTAGSEHLTTVNGWNMSTSATTGDLLQIHTAGFTGADALLHETAVGTTAAMSAAIAQGSMVIGTYAAGAALPIADIINFGSTVYTAATLQAALQANANSIGAAPSAGAFLGLATFADGVHLELIKVANGATSLSAATVVDLVDLVGTSISSVNAHGFQIV